VLKVEVVVIVAVLVVGYVEVWELSEVVVEVYVCVVGYVEV
jgi:hypothetical protein